MSYTVGICVLFESTIIVTKPGDIGGRPNSVTCVGGHGIQTTINIFTIFNTDATSITQGSAVYKSINNEIQHHSI
jgi:hypothetical protein